MAAGASALAAAFSLAVAWHAKRIQGKAADFTNCLEVAGKLRDAMRHVQDAPDDARRKFEFIELLNLLEALALLYNDGRIAASTKKFTGKYLAEVVAEMRANEPMMRLRRESVTGDDTFRELQKFEKRQADAILTLARSYTKEQGIR
ncbi:MAG: hypothetical protein WDN69_29620 [Aliidongia sp.]